MPIRVTRAQLRKLRSSLRDGRSLAIIIQPQLLAAYRSTSAGFREQFSQTGTRIETTRSGFRIVVKNIEKKNQEKERKKTSRRKVERKSRVLTKYSPTQILGKRVSPGDAAKEQQSKSRVVTIHDLAAQIPVTKKQELPGVNTTGLRLMGSIAVRAVIDMMR